MESLRTLISPLERCQYLADRQWQFEYDLIAKASREDYAHRLRQGWRRFGYALFRPICPSCQMCQSLRVVVPSFRADRSQQRAWRGSVNEVSLTIGAPSFTTEKLALYEQFHRHQQAAKNWPAADNDYEDMFVRNPFQTEEWCYYLGDRLVGVGYVDRLADGLSLIYFFYDPGVRDRSPGTFNVLKAIEVARTSGLRYVYLGYYVRGCASLEYKLRFQPNELLVGGAWMPLTTSSPR